MENGSPRQNRSIELLSSPTPPVKSPKSRINPTKKTPKFAISNDGGEGTQEGGAVEGSGPQETEGGDDEDEEDDETDPAHTGTMVGLGEGIPSFGFESGRDRIEYGTMTEKLARVLQDVLHGIEVADKTIFEQSQELNSLNKEIKQTEYAIAQVKGSIKKLQQKNQFTTRQLNQRYGSLFARYPPMAAGVFNILLIVVAAVVTTFFVLMVRHLDYLYWLHEDM